jgi:hypothetical protein
MHGRFHVLKLVAGEISGFYGGGYEGDILL